MARRAYSLATLLAQVNALYPNRSKLSDGWIGDAAHSSTVSQHNPNPAGVVTAQDITHDPAHGADMNILKESLIKDPRTWYVIFNRKIWEGSWKNYVGANPHDKHLHISVKQNPGNYDNANKWNIGGSMANNSLSKEEVISTYTLAFDNEDIQVPANVINAFTGKPNSELLTYLHQDASWLAHKKRVNSPPPAPGFELINEPVYRKK